MKATLLTVGRIRAPFTEADAHYRKLLSRYLTLDVLEARDGEQAVKWLPDRTDLRIVALDRGGATLDSLQWSRWLDRLRHEGRDVWFAIGGPHGLPDEVLAAAGERISFGPATLPHQLARIVLLEQLYRASKILAGEPYHY